MKTKSTYRDAELHGVHVDYVGFSPVCELCLEAEAQAIEQESLLHRLRSTPDHKGPLEYAIEDARDEATSAVGDPADGIEMHNLGKLADAILDHLPSHLTRPAS